MIREIKGGDIPACTALYNWYIANTAITFETKELSVEAFRDRVQRITKHYPYLVLEEAGKIIGYAYLDTFNPRAAYDWIADVSIYLDHEQKGKGYGTQLFEALIRKGEENGFVDLVSLITEGNGPSERIHEKCGFAKKAYFPKFGFKKGHWYGVSYYIKALRDPQENEVLKEPEGF